VPPLEFSDVTTPIGIFRVVYHDQKLHAVDLLERGLAQTELPPDARPHRPPFPKGSPARQILEYFRGERASFELETDPIGGTPFDLKIWKELQRVPAGSTVTYGQLARRAGHPGAARAVGGSMARNPIPIVVPCHRVVGETGSLTGFGLGLWRKRWLLDHEGSWPLRSKSLEGPRGRSQRTLDEPESPRRSGRPRRAS
jgi:O-6-methylguanine DNA methyltransferase